MSSDCVEEESKQWDYLCPQFCDFNATETTDQLKEMDNFFEEVDHELEEENSFYGQQLICDENRQNTPEVNPKSHLNSNIKGLKDSEEAVNDHIYETPPQNKENLEEDNDDNEVFYSTKKYLSVEKKWKLRSTPMRTLQYNGNTPLRETRISSKKKKNKRSDLKKLGAESLMTMNRLMESLPLPSQTTEEDEYSTIPESETEVLTEQNNEIKIQIENEVMSDQQNQHLVEKEEPKEDQDDVFENDNERVLPTQPTNDSVLNRRDSYVIAKLTKTVTVVSPIKSSKTNGSNKKSFANSSRRRGTPIRKSILSAGRKVSSQSIISRLYSTSTKKREGQYKSMAELLKEFETKPRGSDRSQSLDRLGSSQSLSKSRSSSVSSLTQPKSPKLHSILRHRRTPRQTEDIIASQIKKYSFKANPIRKKLFDANFASGIPRVKSSKAPTKAVPMSFMTEKRNECRSTKQVADHKSEEEFRFKANPMPSFKNTNPLQTVKSKSEKKITSFKPFSFDDRIQQLVTKKRTQSENNNQRDIPRNSFKF